MATYEILGTRIDGADEAGTEGTLAISLPDAANGRIRYSVLEVFDAAIPEVQFDLTGGAALFLNSGAISNSDLTVETYVGNLHWGIDNLTQVLTVEFTDLDQEWLFELGGDALPDVNSPGDLADFSDQILSGSPITSGPFRPDAQINLSAIASAQQVDGLTLTGSTSPDRFIGGADDDLISGLGGEDTISGGAGDDVLRGGREGDRLDGGAGRDTLYGQRDDDILNGGDDDDRLNAGGGNDTANGGRGDDFVKGGAQADKVNGGIGNDRLFGNAGDDTLNGGPGRDFLNGGGGDDHFIDGAGDDTMKGGEGADVFVFQYIGGSNKILDFDHTQDVLLFNDVDVDELASVPQILSESSRLTTDGLLFDFGFGNSVLLSGITDVSDWAEASIFVYQEFA
ncbi:MAG: calcium-binding protein [Sulfitobacter sp.]